MVCYMNNEFTKEQLIKDIMQTTNNDNDVKEHLEIVLGYVD